MSKAGLYIGIGLGVVGVGALAYFLMKKPKAPVGMSSNTGLGASLTGDNDVDEEINRVFNYYSQEDSADTIEKERVAWNKKNNEYYNKEQYVMHKTLWELEKQGVVNSQTKDKVQRKFKLGKYSPNAVNVFNACGCNK